MIKFSMGGKALDPRNLKDAVMASVLEGVRNQIREKVGNIRDPDTGEFPTIVVRGDSLDDLKNPGRGLASPCCSDQRTAGLRIRGEPSIAQLEEEFERAQDGRQSSD